jgi:hypothetical protein
MRTVFSFLALLLMCQVVFSCSPEETQGTVSKGLSIFAICPNLETQAGEYGDSFVRKDFGRLVELTNPKYVEMSGGREKLIREVTQTGVELEKDGARVISWTPTEAIQLLKESGTLYAVVPTSLKITLRGRTSDSCVCLIAVSIDQGEHWTFVSSNCVKLSVAFPEVAQKLVICPNNTDVIRWPGSN